MMEQPHFGEAHHHAVLVAWHMVAESHPSVLAHIRRRILALQCHVARLAEFYLFQFFDCHSSYK